MGEHSNQNRSRRKRNLAVKVLLFIIIVTAVILYRLLTRNIQQQKNN